MRQKTNAMQLVLLSGGGGKRLWPLSDDTRSKQFLPLLEREDGIMESMLQRVVRQARESNLTANITIATNAGQMGNISAQLGPEVSIVTEPQRRDTFPAIALAVSYLKLEKKCEDDEVVVVMPCDPYTDLAYFECIQKMVDCVKNNVADLVLMGIIPSSPSEKFGYIVPQKDGRNPQDVRLVARFTEKPAAEYAKTLLAENAYWNGGVFAFRIGYMMDIVRKYVVSASFEETRGKFADFPKISFDYEVAEKAKSVAVVPFSGLWKDLGTWNALTEELHSPTMGNAMLGESCSNTNVINELNIPIFVDGLLDAVVAASSKGILVCSKERSEHIKEYVDKISSRG